LIDYKRTVGADALHPLRPLSEDYSRVPSITGGYEPIATGVSGRGSGWRCRSEWEGANQSVLRTGLFVVLVYGSTWGLKVSLQSAAAAGSSRAAYVFLFGTVWAPTAAALFVAWLADGRRGCAELLRRVFSAPRGAGWFILAAVTPAAAAGLAVALARFFGESAPRPSLSLWPSIIGLQVVTGATGEELGWRGFLVPLLAHHMTFARAAILSALLWSGWHVAGTLFPGMGPATAPLLPFLSLVAMFGVFLAIVFARTGQCSPRSSRTSQ
jgi:membrane protease YdiL (CAAX protease family)